jgi:hypothetical protein
MEGDIQITTSQASELHQQCMDQGILVMWTVTWNTSDYPRQAVARPHLIGPGSTVAQHAILLADSLDALRDLLPPGLTCMKRDPNDDPVIVEIWL